LAIYPNYITFALMIKLNPKYKNYAIILENIPDIFEQQGRVIYDKRNKIKVIEANDGKPLCVKRYHPPRGINLFVYSWGIRKPKGLRAFTYPEMLLSKGIGTPEPMAYIEQRRYGLLRHSYLITEMSPLQHTMYEVGNAKEGEYERLAKAFGEFAAKMHNNGVLHLDFSPGNILWDVDQEGYHFELVDINRMEFRDEISLKEGCKNLCRLWGPKRFFMLLVAHYAAARGLDAVECQVVALKARRKFWKKYGKKHEIEFKLEL